MSYVCFYGTKLYYLFHKSNKIFKKVMKNCKKSLIYPFFRAYHYVMRDIFRNFAVQNSM